MGRKLDWRCAGKTQLKSAFLRWDYAAYVPAGEFCLNKVKDQRWTSLQVALRSLLWFFTFPTWFIKGTSWVQVYHAALLICLGSCQVHASLLFWALDSMLNISPHFHWPSPAGLTGISITRWSIHDWAGPPPTLCQSESPSEPRWHLACSNNSDSPCLWFKVHCLVNLNIRSSNNCFLLKRHFSSQLYISSFFFLYKLICQYFNFLPWH